MTRFLIAFALALAFSSSAFAQDMPLSQILIDGEGWKKVEKPGAKPPAKGTLHLTPSADGGTAFVATAVSRFLYAAPSDGTSASLTYAQPYGELRTRRGEKSIEVTGLTTDRDGRIYAATEIGVQVFDPTGRLCGVLTPAAPGKSERIAFEDDTLTLWIGETKYARKLRTQGLK